MPYPFTLDDILRAQKEKTAPFGQGFSSAVSSPFEKLGSDLEYLGKPTVNLSPEPQNMFDAAGDATLASVKDKGWGLNQTKSVDINNPELADAFNKIVSPETKFDFPSPEKIQPNQDILDMLFKGTNIPTKTEDRKFGPQDLLLPGVELPVTSKKSFAEMTPKEKQTRISEENKLADIAKVIKDETPDELRDALGYRNKMQGYALISQGAQQIGAALAGTKPIEGYGQDIAKFGQQGVSDVALKLEHEMKQKEIALAREANDPKSTISEIQRSTAKDMLNKMGYKNIAAKITDDISSVQLKAVLGSLNFQNLFQQHQTNEARKEMMQLKSQQLRESAQGKLDAKNLTRLDQANKMIQSSLSRNNTAFGRAANIIRSAEAIENLVSGMNPKDIDQRQIYEIASSLDAMLTSGASTVSGREHLIPKSFSKDKSAIEEYILNRPRGAGQEAFVQRLLETVHREKNLAKSQIQRESGKMLSTYGDLQEKVPESWNLMLDMNQLPRDILSPKKIDSPSSDTVKMELPDGRVGIVPREKVEEFKKHGAKEVP